MGTRTVLLVAFLAPLCAAAQQTVSTTGHEAVGGGGSVSVTIGQVGYTEAVSGTGTVRAGVQQPLLVVVTDVEEEDGGASVNVFPNPAGEQTTVSFTAAVPSGTLELLDASGRSVLSAPATGTSTELQLAHIESGSYWLVFQAGEERIVTALSITAGREP